MKTGRNSFRPIAHRGLWRPGGPPENSLAAFEAACAAGYDIELDVQLTADDRAVVFHDPGLKRMTGREGRVRDLQASELARQKLAGSDETIPTLKQALDLVGDRATVFVELKTPVGQEGPLERAVARALDGWRGLAMVISFNPFALAELRRIAPGIPRGLSGSDHVDFDARLAAPDPERPFRPEHLDMAAPAALMAGQRMIEHPRVAALRRSGFPVVVWTLRSAAERDRLARLTDGYMFEGFAA